MEPAITNSVAEAIIAAKEFMSKQAKEERKKNREKSEDGMGNEE